MELAQSGSDMKHVIGERRKEMPLANRDIKY